MKKVLLATLVGATIAGTAFATSVPVTNIQEGTSHVYFDYALHQTIGGTSGNINGYGASLDTALNDKVAVQYAYSHYSKGSENAINGYYKINDQFNAVASIKDQTGEWGYQLGVVGYMPIQDNLQGFAKVAFGNKVTNSLQLGVKYDLNESWNVNAYYQHDGVKGVVGGDDHTVALNGFHVGVGYTF